MKIKVTSKAIAESVAAHIIYGEATCEQIDPFFLINKNESVLAKAIWNNYRRCTLTLEFPGVELTTYTPADYRADALMNQIRL